MLYLISAAVLLILILSAASFFLIWKIYGYIKQASVDGNTKQNPAESKPPLPETEPRHKQYPDGYATNPTHTDEEIFRAEDDMIIAVLSGNQIGAYSKLMEIESYLNKADADWRKRSGLRILLRLRQTLNDFGNAAAEQADFVNELQKKFENQDSYEEVSRGLEQLTQKILSLSIKREEAVKSELVLRAKYFIDNNYSQQLSINEIAAALFISAPYLYKLMHDEITVSPAHYLNNVRIRHVLRLLREKHSVTAISEMVGFETEQTLYRQFKKQMDCSPGKYRNQYL